MTLIEVGGALAFAFMHSFCSRMFEGHESGNPAPRMMVFPLIRYNGDVA